MNSLDNRRLTDVAPGQPMHELCRRYWLPAGLSSDLPEADSDPVRVRLLGKNYVAFRDSAGVVGILDELCPHRRASLMLAQVRDGGIQCIYHGWRFDVTGAILEMPNSADVDVRSRYRAAAYAVREAGGLIWVYVGPSPEPAFPMHRWMEVPDINRHPRIIASRANFVQVLEGLLDTTHLAILHQDSLPRADGSVKVVNNTTRPAVRFATVTAVKGVPRVEVEETTFGLHAAALRAIRHDGEPRLDVRITTYVAPFTVYVANGNVALMTVPVDTDTTYTYIIYWDPNKPFATEPHKGEIEQGTGTAPNIAAAMGITRETLGKPGTASAANNWLQDRAAMRRGESFTGLPPFAMEDAACTSSMGSVSDRKELLVAADLAIVRMRRFLFQASHTIEQGGAAPGFSSVGESHDVGAVFSELGPEQSWKSLIGSGAKSV